MRRFTAIACAALVAGGLVAGCNAEKKTYSDAEYIMFTDTLSTNMVFPDEAYFSVPIASTVACNYDRTVAVEIIDQGSNAIEGYHYRLKSNTITIKAGERTADVEVAGYYTHIQENDSLGFKLKLVMPDQLDWGGRSTPTATRRRSSSTRDATTTSTPSPDGAWLRRCSCTTTPAPG